MQYLKSKFLKELAGTPVKIEKIYPPYRQFFNKKTNSGYQYVIKDGKWNKKEWKDGGFVFTEETPDYKNTNKCYDITVKLPKKVIIDWGEASDEFTFNAVSAAKIRGIAESTVAFGKVPQKEDGTPAYDWEEQFLDKLTNVVVDFSTKNVKTTIGDEEIEYAEFTFRQSKFEDKETEDLPFKS